MDDRYRIFYRQLYDRVLFPGWPPEQLIVPPELRTQAQDEAARGGIRNAIESAARGSERPLRDDAKALLALNFYNLVFLPLAGGGQVDPAIVELDMRQDISMLVRAASTAETDNEEVSAHDVIDALSSNWSNLRVGRHRLWQQT